MFTVFIFCTVIAAFSARRVNLDQSETLTVYGKIRGQSKFSNYGRLYHSFTGIPYAKPPLGKLRFQKPQELDPWTDILNATKEPPICIQRNYLFDTYNPRIEGQEDCLYLNVYVPHRNVRKSGDEKMSLYPVMVFIHWGAFIAGRSTTGYLGPEYFMDQDVILVTLNYRLGPFGFLSTTDDEAPGNYALKDQVAALKWVQRNICFFGGDKNNVTIFGQSSGAGSVHYHLLSPASKGLFSKAISQSGSALSGWALPTNVLQKQIASIQAQFVGCENFTSNSKDLIDCLRSVPAEEILKTQDNFRKFYGNPLVIFGPVTETKSERNLEPFITKTPLEYILNGEYRNVPWLTGVVKNDGLVKAASLIRPRKVREELNENFEEILTNLLLILSLSTADPQSLYKNLSTFYLGGRELIDLDDPKTIQGFVDMYSDRAFFYPMYQSILLHTKHNHTPIYLYSFEYEGRHSYVDLFSSTREKVDYHWGTCHCDDLLYLFNSPELIATDKPWNDVRMTNILITLWTNFARQGVPKITNDATFAKLNWQPLDIDVADKDVNGQIRLLNITGNYKTGLNMEVTNGFYQERMKFWTDSDIFENNYRLN